VSFYFGGLWLPAKAETGGTMLVGAPGTGKTLMLRMTMGSVVSHFSDELDARAVVADIKQDMVSILLGMGVPESRLCLMNPWDRRCHEWNMAADVTGPDVSLQIATIFIPEDTGQNRYFTDAARDLLTALMNVFIEKGREKQQQDGTKPEWTMADLVFAMRSRRHLVHVLGQTEEGRDLIDLHLSAGETSISVLSTARSRLAPFAVPAALWRHAGRAGRRMSLQKFLKINGGVLVLGNNAKAQAPMQAINRVLFLRLSQLVLDQTESATRRTHFFLDELSKLGRLDGLDDLMRVGRSKGTAVMILFQDISGLRAVYGKDVADEITAMCSSYGAFKLAGSESPEWASLLFGDQERREFHESHSTNSGLSPQGFSTSANHGESEHIRQPRNFIASQFRALPLPEKGEPLYGFFHTPFIPQEKSSWRKWLHIREQRRGGAVSYEAAIPPEEIAELLHEPASADLNFLPWIDEDGQENQSLKKLLPWDDADYRRLNIPPLPAAADEKDTEKDKEDESADEDEESDAAARGGTTPHLSDVLFPDLPSARLS